MDKSTGGVGPARIAPVAHAVPRRRSRLSLVFFASCILSSSCAVLPSVLLSLAWFVLDYARAVLCYFTHLASAYPCAFFSFFTAASLFSFCPSLCCSSRPRASHPAMFTRYLALPLLLLVLSLGSWVVPLHTTARALPCSSRPLIQAVFSSLPYPGHHDGSDRGPRWILDHHAIALIAAPALRLRQALTPTVIVAAAAAATHTVDLMITSATIQSGGGDFGDCANISAASCVNGVAAVASVKRRVMRDYEAANVTVLDRPPPGTEPALSSSTSPASISQSTVQTLLMNEVDRTSIFTKLHPLDWGINYDVFHHFNTSYMFARVTFVTPQPSVAYQRHSSRAILVDNVDFDQGHPLHSVVEGVALDFHTGTQLVAVRAVYAGLSVAVAAAAQALQQASDANQTAIRRSVLIAHDAPPHVVLAALQRHQQELNERSGETAPSPQPTAVVYLFAAKADVGVRRVGSTWLVNISSTAGDLHRIKFTSDKPLTTPALETVSLVVEDLSHPSVKTDPQYPSDQAFVLREAARSEQNNPIAGTSTTMPSPRTPTARALCIAQECAMGNLWAEAVRFETKADFSLFPGPWLGGGWPGGEVRRLHLYRAFGFTNQLCTARVFGLTVFEMIRDTIGRNSFNPDGDPNAALADSFLPQVDGIRITFNRHALSAQRRLKQIEIWNEAAKAYQPLERLKMYTVGGISYTCTGWQPYMEYLAARYENETAPIHFPQKDLHLTVESYLREVTKTRGHYDAGLRSRLRQSTSAADMFTGWIHTASACTTAQFYQASIKSCMPCPDGQHNPERAAECIVIAVPADSSLPVSTLIAIGVATVVLLIALPAVALWGATLWRRHKRLRWCPTDPSVPFTVMFVTVKNEIGMRELSPNGTMQVLKNVRAVVHDAAQQWQCYTAQTLDAHTMLVCRDPARAVLCACTIYSALDHIDWRLVAAAPRRHSTASNDVPSTPRHAPRLSASTGLSGEARRSTVMRDSSDAYATSIPSIVPQASIGLYHGLGRIDFDDARDHYTYAGLVVDAAVSVADVACGGQLLAAETTLNAAKDDGEPSLRESIDAVSHDDFHWKVLPHGPEELLVQVTPEDCAPRDFTFSERALDDDDDGVAGALSAALETAAGGLTSRRVAAVTLCVMDLRSAFCFNSRVDHVRHCEAALAAVQRSTRPHDLISSADGFFTVVVNAAEVRTAQSATAAVSSALEAIDAVEEATGLRACAGVAVAPAVVGESSGRVVVAGVAVERSRVLALAAANHESQPQVLASAEMRPELEPHFDIVATDVFAWPTMCVPSATVHHASVELREERRLRRAKVRAAVAAAKEAPASLTSGAKDAAEAAQADDMMAAFGLAIPGGAPAPRKKTPNTPPAVQLLPPAPADPQEESAAKTSPKPEALMPGLLTPGGALGLASFEEVPPQGSLIPSLSDRSVHGASCGTALPVMSPGTDVPLDAQRRFSTAVGDEAAEDSPTPPPPLEASPCDAVSPPRAGADAATPPPSKVIGFPAVSAVRDAPPPGTVEDEEEQVPSLPPLPSQPLPVPTFAEMDIAGDSLATSSRRTPQQSGSSRPNLSQSHSHHSQSHSLRSATSRSSLTFVAKDGSPLSRPQRATGSNTPQSPFANLTRSGRLRSQDSSPHRSPDPHTPGSRDPLAASGIRSIRGESPMNARGLALVYSVEREKIAGEDDEWLYQLKNNLSANAPHTATNAAFQSFFSTEGPALPEAVTRPSKVVSNKTSPPAAPPLSSPPPTVRLPSPQATAADQPSSAPALPSFPARPSSAQRSVSPHGGGTMAHGAASMGSTVAAATVTDPAALASDPVVAVTSASASTATTAAGQAPSPNDNSRRSRGSAARASPMDTLDGGASASQRDSNNLSVGGLGSPFSGPATPEADECLAPPSHLTAHQWGALIERHMQSGIPPVVAKRLARIEAAVYVPETKDATLRHKRFVHYARARTATLLVTFQE